MKLKIFKSDINSSFLPIVSALIVFLASLSLSIVFLSGKALNSWKYTIESSISIQVLPDFDNKNPETQMIEKTKKLSEALSKLPFVKTTKIINKKAMEEIMSPWIHKDFKIQYAILPQIIEVKTNQNISTIQFEQIQKDVVKGDKDIKVYKHEDWIKRAGLITKIFMNLALIILSVSLIAMFGIISYATKTSMMIQMRIIKLLNIMGAKDTFIASSFASTSSRLCFIGGIIGTLVSVPVLILITHVAKTSGSSIFAYIGFSAFNWITLILLPFISYGISMFSSYYTVLKELKKG